MASPIDGAAGVTRTLDLLITNQLLYQLSYSSIAEAALKREPTRRREL